ATIGCRARMIVELATVVNSSDLNHSAKCVPRNTPEIMSSSQFFLDIFLNSARFIHTTGNNKRHAIYIRYILKIVDGALDHLTNIAANDITMIDTVNGNAIDGVFLLS